MIPLENRIEDLEDTSNTLSNFLKNSLQRINEQYIADNQTKEFQIGLNNVYLFLNSHINLRCALLITIHSTTLRIDTIFKSSDQAIPEISLNNNKLTIKGSANSRGYLYLLRNTVAA